MANLQVPKSKALVIFAFPGMGKTPYILHHSGWFDADFGLFRTSMGVDKKDEQILIGPYAKLIVEYIKNGFNIMTNEPKLIERVKAYVASGVIAADITMYLPIDLRYSAKKMGVSTKQIGQWVSGWEAVAAKAHVPVVKIPIGLDKYLS